ncbi:Zinc finger, RING/FYVE/PHD-type [Corchorus olitorius]|uniref:Zinc finger, RING/FYVE/PHD-type n=1 Tax=Corchorus olitorius TaxID=93759 RepID=A0A1R3K6R6_9ROSI|nr:Zinc finger, RING/FYVE/PHD-type [Corchorus olitorius]
MAVYYYKFKSAKDFDSIVMDGSFISVGTLKEKIFESKHMGRGTDFDLVVTNAQTNEEYVDEAMLIPKNTSVLIRRVPGMRRMPIVAAPEPKVENPIENAQQPEKSNLDFEWDEFGNDVYSIPETLPVKSSNPLPTNKADDDEDSRIKALINTPALDWQRQGADGCGPGRGFGRGFGMERKTPPEGYVCHRCKVAGHFIQHCPTNGDPKYDIKRVKPPTGIPKSMLMATPDGSYALPSGGVAVLKPNEGAFEKEIEGLPSSSSHCVGDVPPELHCPLCKEVMKDAVLTSKCCFMSFCDKCIRDQIMSKSKCVCSATNILADDLLPNKTLRDTINRIILESGNSSGGSTCTFQVQDMESAGCPQPKVASPTTSTSAESKGEQKPTSASAKQESLNLELMSVKEPASGSQGISAPLVEEQVQQRVASGEAQAGKKKKKNKVPQDFQTDNYMMSMGPAAAYYNPYWNGGMQPGSGMDGFMGPNYDGAMAYMGGYGLGPVDMDMPFGIGGVNVMPTDPFGAQYMFPLAEFGMGMNVPPPIMSRDQEFEAPQADLRENERRGERDFSRDRELGRQVSSRQMMGGDHRHEIPRHRSDRTTPARSLRDHEGPPGRPAKRKADQHHDRDSHHHHKPEGEVSKKQKLSSGHHKPSSNRYYDDYKSSDDDRHYKRKPSRYESSPPPSAHEWEEEARHSRGSRERERSSYSKHR